MTLDYIFSNKFLFDPVPSSDSKFYLPLLIIFGILLLASIIVRLVKMDMVVKKRQSTCYLTLSILGLLYLFARYEGLPWLGSRLFLSLLLLATIIWLTYLSIWGVRYSSKKTKETFKEKKFEKYLPKKKIKA